MGSSTIRRTNVRRTTSFGALVAVALLAGCGGDDDTDSTTDGQTDDTAEVATGNETEPPPTAPPSPDDDDTDAGQTATTAVEGGVEVDEVPDDPAERGEPTGTISVDGQTWEVAGFARALEGGEVVELGGDFLICEADNPAFPGDANIIAVLDDDLQFSFLKSGDTTTAEYGGLFGADETTSVEFDRDGTTISGTAEFAESGSASFVLDCG